MPSTSTTKTKKLLPDEAKEWKSLKAKSVKYKIPIKRVGAANVAFDDKIIVQLGTMSDTQIMDARIKIKKRFQNK
jgi:hypothetical protein